MTNPTVPRAYKSEIKAAIHIGRHVLIGANSTVMPGASIAEGTTIGAHSLVLKPTDPWSIYAGNPAKRIKDRGRDLLVYEAQYLDQDE